MLWLSDARGIYIPRDFAQSFENRDKHVSGVSEQDWGILEYGPNHEHYWDTWQNVCDNATVTDTKGNKYSLHQEGDLWLIPEGMEWDDETENFVWPEEEEDADYDDDGNLRAGVDHDQDD